MTEPATASAVAPPATMVDAWQRQPPFDRLEPAALALIRERATRATYAAGERIVAAGMPAARALHIVERGRVTATPSDPDELNEEPYPSLGTGDAFPVVALFTDGPVTSEYHASEPTACLVLDGPSVRALLRCSPVLLQECVARVRALLQQARLRVRAEAPHVASEQQSMSSTLRSIVRRAPVMCPPDVLLRDALRIMREARVGSILVGTSDSPPLGIFTVQDLLDRVVLDGTGLDVPVASVMTRDVVTLPADASAYEAALVMAQHHKRHVPVLEEGRVLGMISQRDLFSVQRNTLRQLPGTIAAAQDEPALVQAAHDIRELARDMLRHGVPAEHLTQFIASLNDRLTERVLQLELPRHRLDDVRVCWIALGSEGRLEQTFSTDQDNGIIFRVPPDGTPDAVRERVLPFADAVNRTLDACGFPLCKGDIMARNPRWCLSLPEWQAQFSTWIRNTAPQAALNSAIFFDFRPIFGDATLAGSLRAWLLEATRATPRFLLDMAQAALATRPPLGLWRDFVFDASPDHPHTIDLKLYGLRPFVDAARVNALRHGIAHTATAQRIRLAAPALGIAQDDARAMVDGFYFVQLLRLRHQQFDPDGARAPNRIDPDRLNAFDRRMLKESLRQAKTLQQRLALDYPVSV